MLNAIKKTAAVTGLILITSNAYASEENGFYVWANVTDVDPIVNSHYEEIPTSSCRIVKERRYRDRNNDVLPTLFGSVIGGVIGNQFGKGNGKRAMTVVGAIAGASIANQNSSPRYDRRKVCETEYTTRRVESVDGYRVTYEYLGQEFERVTEDHPGKRMKLYVTAEPVSDNYI